MILGARSHACAGVRCGTAPLMGGVLKPCMGRTGKMEGWWKTEEREERKGAGVNHHYSRLKMVTPERLTIPAPVIQGREEITGYH